MKKQIIKLRRLIEKTMPYRFYNILLNLSFIAFLLMVLSVVVMNYIKVEAEAFDENNTFRYTYIEVDQVQELVNQYYVADDGTFVYLYYAQNDEIPNHKIVGVPKLMNEEILKELIPFFQRLYPNLKVNNVDDLMQYTGNYYFDSTAPTLLYDMQIIIIFSCIPFIIWLIIFFIRIYYRRCYVDSLKNIILNKEVTCLIDQLKVPRNVYDSFNVSVLFDYLVINHPSPYVIDIQNIVWMYVEKKKFFFLFDQKLTFVIYGKNLKKTRVLICSAFSAKNKTQMNELLSFVSQVNSKALIGYSQHNETIFNQLKKDNDA